MPYNVAMIGCGAMGNVHAEAWTRRGDKVVTCYDPLPDRKAAMAAKYGATPCDSMESAVRDERVQVVSVCTPVCFHSPISVFAAEHGRHVISEKPIALTLAQADAMTAAAKANRVQVAVSYQYRGLPRYQRYREIFQRDAFGGPILARFVDVRSIRPKPAMHSQSQNGGPIIDMAGHYFDLFRWITAQEPTRVYARGHVYGKGKPFLAHITDFAIDAAEILVDFTGGHVLSVLVNWGLPEGHPGYGTEELAGPDLVVSPKGDKISERYCDREVLHDLAPAPFGNTVRIEDLVAAIENRQPLELDTDTARRALAVSLAALESIRTRAAVDL